MKKTIIFLLISVFTFSLSAQSRNYNLLIGTYTNPGKSEGIYAYHIDMKTNEISQI